MKTDILTGTIDKVVPGGLRLVRGEQGVVFLNSGLPGETVSFKFTKNKKGPPTVKYSKSLVQAKQESPLNVSTT